MVLLGTPDHYSTVYQLSSSVWLGFFLQMPDYFFFLQVIICREGLIFDLVMFQRELSFFFVLSGEGQNSFPLIKTSPVGQISLSFSI